MPSHLKELVHARMAKTGESWSTAKRNVQGQHSSGATPLKTPPTLPVGPAAEPPVAAQPLPPPVAAAAADVRTPATTHSERHTLVVDGEIEIRFLVESAGHIEIGSDVSAPGLHVTWLEVGNVSRIEGMPAAESVSGFPVPAGRMLRLRLRNMGPTTRNVRFDLVPSEPTQTPAGVLEALLASLRVATPFAVLIERDSWSGGRSADPGVAFRSPPPDAGGPSAESGSVTKSITRIEMEMLLNAGAADGQVFQMIRSFHGAGGRTFSAPCDNCRRWIHCGAEEHEGACVCGQRYRVVFDLADVERTLLRVSGRGPRCMDCGQDFTGGSTREVWRPRNAWQIQCDACFTKTSTRIAVTMKDGTPFTVYGDRDERGDLYEVRGGATVFGTIRLLPGGKSECFMKVPTADRYFAEIVGHLLNKETASSDRAGGSTGAGREGPKAPSMRYPDRREVKFTRTKDDRVHASFKGDTGGDYEAFGPNEDAAFRELEYTVQSDVENVHDYSAEDRGFEWDGPSD